MEINKIDNYLEFIFSNEKFLLDPPDLNEELPIILTDFSLKKNRNRIFNSPGEYNVGEVYFRGFDDKNYISYLFENQEGKVLYLNNNLSEETLKKIKSDRIEIDALIIKESLKLEIINELKPKLIFSFKDLNLVKFQKEKVSKVKVNLNKVKNLIYVFR